jgi:hypothetical protein
MIKLPNMRLELVLRLLSLVPGLRADSSDSDPKSDKLVDPALRNANHIFNAIHSSMRQWGSSVNHNGMSFFLASIPAGMHLYHGRQDNKSVIGPEWLAFEPEHALVFARPRPRRPSPDDSHKTSSTGESLKKLASNTPEFSPSWFIPADSGSSIADLALQSSLHGDFEHLAPYLSDTIRDSTYSPAEQSPIQAQRDKDDEIEGGFLHTYRTKHPLSLLYIDGMSAGKTFKGTLDSTDAVLTRWNSTADHGIIGEWVLAFCLCNMATDKWKGSIDGFLRMEMGFEIILCDFEKHLKAESIQKTARRPHKLIPGALSDISYYRVVASRFDGIGGNRVSIDYDHFVTSFSYDIDLFESGERHPRLLNISNDTLTRIHDDVTTMVLDHGKSSSAKNEDTNGDVKSAQATDYNWQAITDMLVFRYADRLAYLSSAAIPDLEHFRSEVNLLVESYIDYMTRNSTLEIAGCVTHYLPSDLPTPIPRAAQAIMDVSNTLCSSLFSALAARSLEVAQAKIRSLMDYLQWTHWKRCRGCALDEVCFLPIWPVGRKQDWDQPTCVNELPKSGQDNYWFDERDRGKGPWMELED